MWTVIKFNKDQLNFLKSELKNKLGRDFQFYCPKIIIEKFKNNKLVKKECNLLGDYLFCFNDIFKEKKITNQLNNIKGVKYFLDGFMIYQNEINDFIKKCKYLENKDGYITHSVFDAEIDKFYRFSNGPFTKKIFKILSIQRNKFEILMGNIKTTIKKKDYLISPL